MLEKSKDLIFSKNKYLFNSPPLLPNDKYISRVHEHRHLGLWLSENLDWEKQIQSCCLKANGKLAVLQSVKFLDRTTLDLLYKLTIRSLHCSVQKSAKKCPPKKGNKCKKGRFYCIGATIRTP